MSPGPNPFKTRVLNAPPGNSECDPLEIMDTVVSGMRCVVSAWEPTPEEIEAINRGEKIWLYVFSGTHPMVSLSAGERP